MSYPDQGGRHDGTDGLLSRSAALVLAVLWLAATGHVPAALAQGQAIIVPPPRIQPSSHPPPAAPARLEGALAAPRPARSLTWKDVPDDAGRALDLEWRRSPDDTLRRTAVQGYYVMRSENPGGPWTLVDSVVAGASSYRDQSAGLQRGTIYFYRIDAYGAGGITPQGSVTGPAIAVSQWFNHTRWSVLVLTMVFFAFVLFFIQNAQGEGKKPFVRRIPGIDAIEEAIGRATEMGRPVLYVPGVQDIDEMQTVQSLIVLESVAKTTARYQTPLKVPVTYPIPFTIAQEMVRGGYVHAGHPEQYDPDSVQFVSPEQFAYVAAVTGIMMRDRPAAHIFLGAFFAESLLLAETGFATGAIQVAGTANANQLPFFVAACDYTLIGEELFAASAYLSGEPKLVGSLKGADLMKIVIVALVLGGCLLETLGRHGLTSWLSTQ